MSLNGGANCSTRWPEGERAHVGWGLEEALAFGESSIFKLSESE